MPEDPETAVEALRTKARTVVAVDLPGLRRHRHRWRPKLVSCAFRLRSRWGSGLSVLIHW